MLTRARRNQRCFQPAVEYLGLRVVPSSILDDLVPVPDIGLEDIVIPTGEDPIPEAISPSCSKEALTPVMLEEYELLLPFPTSPA